MNEIRCQYDVGGRGLSLIEILFAVAILGAMLLPIWFVFFQSSQVVTEGQAEAQVINLGAAFCGQVRRLDPQNLPETAAPVTLRPVAGGVYTLGGAPGLNSIELPGWDDGNLTLAYEITRLGPLPRVARLAMLRVHWRDRAGHPRTARFPELLTHE